MTDAEYEDVYQEALYCLGENASVGIPFLKPDGTRVCEVDGRVLNDDQVLDMWWGTEIADQIRREYPRDRPAT
jgi:hypothetical protein